jgi:hypothetical protein
MVGVFYSIFWRLGITINGFVPSVQAALEQFCLHSIVSLTNYSIPTL